MNRLRDIVEREGGLRGDPLFRRGVELLQATPATEAEPDAKARVWRAIRQAPSPAARGLRTLALKLAVAGAVALVAGTAGAVIVHRWIAPRIDADKVGVVVPPAALRSHASPATRADTPVEADVPAEAPTPKVVARAIARKPAAAPVAASSVARERTEVLDALVALRREHDAVRAGTLLARYLSAHPRGTLREEALVLAIEAADARGDRAAAEPLARAYLSEFPEGRFLAFARSHAK